VDTGFIVFNERNYPLFGKFIQSLGVRSRPSDMSFSVSDRASGLEYNAASIRGLVCERKNLIRPGFYRMLGDILKFYRQSPSLLETGSDETTLGDYLEANGYGADFVNNHIIPMASALWSSPPDTVARFPARYFVAFMHNHSMLQIAKRPQWRTIHGGSSEYVRSFENAFRGQIRLNSCVTGVRGLPNGIQVSTSQDHVRYDAVILACHSNQARDILDERMEEQRSLLGEIPFQRNEVVLHTDASVMPRNRRAWASWNVVRLAERRDEFLVTYYMNLLQGIAHPEPLLVSLNPACHIEKDKVLLRRQYDHPVYTSRSLRARRDLLKLSGRDGVHFAGAYLGWGFHEDGARSAQAVIDAIGNQRMADAA